jgi:acetyltransferase
MNSAIEALLRPKSIAILGASADFQKLHGRTLKALLDKGYAWQIYPVNPKYGHVADLRCYEDVAGLRDITMQTFAEGKSLDALAALVRYAEARRNLLADNASR